MRVANTPVTELFGNGTVSGRNIFGCVLASNLLSVKPHTHVIIEFYLQRELPEVGVVMVHVGSDRGTKKSLLVLVVECVEFLSLYFWDTSLQLVAVLSKILWELELSGMLGWHKQERMTANS